VVRGSGLSRSGVLNSPKKLCRRRIVQKQGDPPPSRPRDRRNRRSAAMDGLKPAVGFATTRARQVLRAKLYRKRNSTEHKKARRPLLNQTAVVRRETPNSSRDHPPAHSASRTVNDFGYRRRPERRFKSGTHLFARYLPHG